MIKLQESSKKKILVIGCVLLVTFFSFLIINKLKFIEISEKESQFVRKLAIEQQIKKLEAAQANGNSSAEKLARKELFKLLPKKLAGTFFMARNMLVDIEFYGKVVDQNDNPIEGAEVLITVGGGGSLAPGSGDGVYKTDKDGFFRLKAKGQKFSVYIRHPDISEFVARAGNSKIIYKMLQFDPYPIESIGTPGWTEHTSRKNPYIFKVWRESVFGDVWHEENGKARILANEGVLTWLDSTTTKNRHKTEDQYSPSGLFTISCYRGDDRDPSQPEWRNAGSWSMTLAPINGGIQLAPENDVYLNLAPEAGYQPEITVGRQAGSPDYTYRLSNQTYYFTAHDGRVFGSLRVEFDPFFTRERDRCQIIIDIKHTVDGSRNLAIKGESTFN